MRRGAAVSRGTAEARAFAESVAGILDRHARVDEPWEPGQAAAGEYPGLTSALDELGWSTVARDPTLVACAGLGAIELGRRLAPLREVDRLLGGGPMTGELVRSLGSDSVALGALANRPERWTVLRSEPVASADGLEVRRILELEESRPLGDGSWATAVNAWMAASTGYLAGLGEAALELTKAYVTQRRAFGTTLAALAPVQQLLADTATLVRGVRLLAGDGPDADGLAHSAHAVADACANCHQVTGAIGFTLEYPLHRYTQRARGLAAWNDALLEVPLQPPAITR